MKYILQLHTGPKNEPLFLKDAILNKIKYITDRLNVESIIYGWSMDKELNTSISSLCDTQNVEQILWLPVFAEIQDDKKSDRLIKIANGIESNHNFYGSDSFDFVCPSSSANLEEVVNFVNYFMKYTNIKGVMLDRIRYASGAAGVQNMLGCWCENCRKIYADAGVNLQYFLENSGHFKINDFLPDDLKGFVYEYKNIHIDSLMKVKREIINKQVSVLCDEFKRKGLFVGIDTFSPAIADFVGQDIIALGKKADFVKPMVYLRTSAPAGIPYELDSLGKEVSSRINTLWGENCKEIATNVAQIKKLLEAGINVTPGIDANAIKGICSSDPDYIRQYITELENIGCSKVVLSWNIMEMSDEMIKSLE